MKALGKTLFGDRRNVIIVVIVLVAECMLVQSGFTRAASFAIPPILLAAAAYLSHH